MSGEPTTSPALGRRLADRLPTDRGSLVAGTAVVAAVAVATRRLLTIAGNLPFDPISPPAVVGGVLSVLTPLGLAVAAGSSGLASDRPPVRVGLLFVAAFVTIAALTPAAGLPAIIGISSGGAIALLGWVDRPSRSATYRRLATAGAATIGIVLSLGGTVGIASGGTRTLGVVATLVALALVGLEGPVDRRSAAVGLGAAGGIVAAGITAPFVTGATLLVAFSITGVSILVVGVAAGSVVATITASLRDRAVLPAAGGVLCLCAGIPTTAERAAALVVGLTLVACRTELAPRGEFV